VTARIANLSLVNQFGFGGYGAMGIALIGMDFKPNHSFVIP
jgi:hypothetical protein